MSRGDDLDPIEWLQTYADTANARNKRGALYRMLQDFAPHHLMECVAVGGLRFGGRIHELRHRGGLDIRTIFKENELGTSETWYQLVDHRPRQGAMQL